MNCQWNALLGILPLWMRTDVDRLGKEAMQELRLRINAPPELTMASGSLFLTRKIRREDIDFTVNAASSFSPWAAATIAKGYLTAEGGHRIGLCGEAVCKGGSVTGIRQITSLNIRVARDFPDIGRAILSARGSVLILGAPGWGKTTLLRDMARQLSSRDCVAVVDQRGELFPEGISRGRRMDVLFGTPKDQGVDMVLRTMGPEWIALDEITAPEDSTAVLQAFGCGVRILASAHGTSLEDFRRRLVFQPLVRSGVFETAFILGADKSFRQERMV